MDSLSTFGHDPADAAVFHHDPIDDLEPLPDSPYLQMADALSAVLVWLSENKVRNVSGLRHQNGTRRYFSASKASLRFMAFLYCVRPDLVGGSLREIARRCDCSHEAIRKHVDEFRVRFNFHTPLQWDAQARANLSTAISAHHRHRTDC